MRLKIAGDTSMASLKTILFMPLAINDFQILLLEALMITV